MTKKIRLTFSDREGKGDCFVDSWTLRETISSKAFEIEILNNLKNEFLFYTKFVGYVGGYRDADFLNNLMNKCIERINEDRRYHIRERAKGRPTQKFLNVMHHHFEVLRGSVWKESEYYLNSSQEVAAAVCGINHLVHETEAWIRSEHGLFGILTEFDGSNRTQLPAESVQDFQMNIDFGDMVLHYCQIGKTWWEVFTDKDEKIFESAIQPLELVSGEFDILWNDNPKEPQGFDKFKVFLKKWGKDISDPELRIGYNCVAKWDNAHSLSQDELRAEMTKRMYLSKIEFLNSGEVIAYREFPISREFYVDL